MSTTTGRTRTGPAMANGPPADLDTLTGSFAELMKRRAPSAPSPTATTDDDALLATPRRRASPRFDAAAADEDGSADQGLALDVRARDAADLPARGPGPLRNVAARGLDLGWVESPGAGPRPGGHGLTRAGVPRSRSTSSSHSSSHDAALSSSGTSEDDGLLTDSAATSPASEKGPYPSTAGTSVSSIANELHADSSVETLKPAAWSQEAVSPRSPAGPFHLSRPPPPRTSSIPGTPPPGSSIASDPKMSPHPLRRSPASVPAGTELASSFRPAFDQAGASAVPAGTASPRPSPASPQPKLFKARSLFRQDRVPDPAAGHADALASGVRSSQMHASSSGGSHDRDSVSTTDPSLDAALPQLPDSGSAGAGRKPDPARSSTSSSTLPEADGSTTPRGLHHHQRPSVHHRKTHSLSFMRNFLGVGDRSAPHIVPPVAAASGPGVGKRSSGAFVTPGSVSRHASSSSSSTVAAPAESILTKDDLQELEEFGVRFVDRSTGDDSQSLRRSFDRRSISSNSTSVPSPGSPTASPTFSTKMLLESRRVSNSSLLSNASQTHGASPRAPTLSRNNSSGSGGGGSIKRRRVSHGRSLSHLVSPTAGKNIAAHMVITAVVENGLSAGMSALQTDQKGVTAIARSPIGIDAKTLAEKLGRAGTKASGEARRLLVIDTRRLSHFVGMAGRIKGSINVNFPSLLIKRFRKGSTDNFQLGSFVTTETGKARFSNLTSTAETPADPLRDMDICVVDEHLTERDVAGTPGSWGTATGSGTGVVLLSVLNRIASDRQWPGGLFYLQGSFSDFAEDDAVQHWVVQGETPNEDRPSHARLHVSTEASERQDDVPELSIASADSRHPVKPGLLRLQPSGPSRTLPRIETMSTPASPAVDWQTSSISAPPEGRPRLLIPGLGGGGGGRGKLPMLKKLNTSEFALGTAGRPIPTKAPTPLADVHSGPLHLGPNDGLSVQELARSQARSPTVPGFDRSVHSGLKGAGMLGAVDDAPLSPAPTTHPEIQFSASTIIPGFLFLGGEPRFPADFAELEAFGVTRVINVALECVEEEGECRKRGWDYQKVPLRDFVEEVGVQDAFNKVNALLDNAAAASAPTYLHCVAGKSRSVSCTIAYLMHRYGWSLKTAYEHVGDRRKGISPNIGFLAELLSFESRTAANKDGSSQRPDGQGGLVGEGSATNGGPSLAFLGNARNTQSAPSLA